MNNSSSLSSSDDDEEEEAKREKRLISRRGETTRPMYWCRNQMNENAYIELGNVAV
uniref:Uncharacterized protein n=1 Tax=Arundo donax TaxID=35708 RepID=A0A0A9CBL9_ARUDO